MKRRLAIFLAVTGLWASGVVARLYHLQVVEQETYRRKAARQQQRVIDLAPPRGGIYDARGRALAVSVAVESAFAVPEEIADPTAAAARIARVLKLDAGRLARDLARREKDFVWVARQLDPPQAAALKALGLPGIGFLEESKRYYPMRSLAANVIGVVGTDHRGLEGLEAMYDGVIAGAPVRRTVLRDARLTAVLSPDFPFAEPEPGSDLHLTIDATIQQIAEAELARAVAEHRARWGTAIVLDPWSGAILAMATAPGFDPNDFKRFPESHRRNRAVADAFEPGSTFKMVTAAAALEANLVDPEDRFDCQLGSIVLAGVRIRDHKPFGSLSLREILAKSSNVGAIKVGLLAGRERLAGTIEAFGFGAATGVDLPGESPGIVRPLTRWQPRSAAYISFGQEISVTALQLASAFAAVANGGTLYRPYAVGAVGRGEVAEPRRERPQELGHPIGAATARTLERLLESVVTDGTGKAAAIPGYPVAGKTGTGQKAVPGEGYSDRRVMASFAGFAPARRPAVLCLVVLDEPVGRIHGGEAAAPAFARIVAQTLLYLGIPPEREPLARWPGEPAPEPEAEQGIAAAGEERPQEDEVALAEATGAGGEETPEDGSPAVPSGPTVPDVTGLAARAAVVAAADLGLRVRLHGSGVVRRQEPAAGTPLLSSRVMDLWLDTGGHAVGTAGEARGGRAVAAARRGAGEGGIFEPPGPAQPSGTASGEMLPAGAERSGAAAAGGAAGGRR